MRFTNASAAASASHHQNMLWLLNHFNSTKGCAFNSTYCSTHPEEVLSCLLAQHGTKHTKKQHRLQQMLQHSSSHSAAESG
jgi:hypothetical protein